MKNKIKNEFLVAFCTLFLFVLWTILVRFVDVKAVGPNNSSVGFAAINKAFHDFTGVHITLYTITDWLGLVPVFFAFGFAVFGFLLWIKRKNMFKVDYNILVLGGFYIVTLAMYLLFESVVINYRPTLINGYLEVSYPSSTTLLVMCVMPTAIMQFKWRLKSKILQNLVTTCISIFIVFMVVGRLLSGVHWLTDIVGGALLSAGLVTLFHAVCGLKNKT